MNKILFAIVLMTVVAVVISGCAAGNVVKINTPVPNADSGTPAPNGQINVPGVSLQVNAPGQNPLANKADANGHVAGLWMGIWHGVISPITLIVSFFNPIVQMYEVHNDGSQYNLGFLIGVAIVFLLLGALVGSRH